MGFFFCPRFRRNRRSPDSSEFTRSYQLDHLGSSLLPHEPPEVMPHSLEEQARFERQSSSSGGLSGRIRCRFSRQVRDWHGRPRRSRRGRRTPGFPFASKYSAINPGPPTSYDPASSLTSERGYDSDAQYIATPKHPVHPPEYPANRFRNGVPLSPRRQHYRDPDTNPPRDRNFGLVVDGRGFAGEQTLGHRDGRESQLSWSSQDRHGAAHFQNVDVGSPRGKPMSPCPTVREWAQERAAQGSRMHEMHRPHLHAPLARPPIPMGGFEENMSQYANYGYDMGASGYSSHTPGKPTTYTTSADSMASGPQQISVRKRHQRPRREKKMDEHSVHLGEMNIPRMLASPSSSTYMLPTNHSFDENQSGSNVGRWSENPHHGFPCPAPNTPAWDPMDPKLRIDPIQEPRSSYSPKTSLSSAPCDYYDQRTHHHYQDLTGNFSPRRPQLVTLHQKEVLGTNPNVEPILDTSAPDTSEALKSRFIEQFEPSRSALSILPDSHDNADKDAVTPRRVSVGWMSEGRRVGYGYTFIPVDDPNEEKGQLNEPGSPRSCNSKKPDGSTAGKAHVPLSKQQSEQREQDSKSPSKTSESSFDISVVLNKLNLPRLANANSSLKANNMSKTASYGSTAPPLLGVLAKRKKSQQDAESNTEKENPWEFCSWVRHDQTSNNKHGPLQNAIPSIQNTEAQIIEKLANAWTNRHKVTAIARNIEKRAVAKLATSTEQFPAIQRTANRVLRLKSPGRRTRMSRIGGDGLKYPAKSSAGGKRSSRWVVGNRTSIQSINRARKAERTSSGSNADWESVYEECLEEHPIPE